MVDEKKPTAEELHLQTLQGVQYLHSLCDQLLASGAVDAGNGKLQIHPFMTVLQYEAHRKLEEFSYRISDMFTHIHLRTEQGVEETAQNVAKKEQLAKGLVVHKGGKDEDPS